MVARRAWRATGPALVFGAIAAWLHRALYPTVVDQDAFYHLKHAWEYRTRGLFDSAFPWAQFSAVRREGADLWYGFHLALIPFTTGDLLTGLRVGAAAVTVAALLLVHAGYARLGIRWALGWTLVFAFVSTDMLFRLLMLRPHPVSLGLFVLLLARALRDDASVAALALLAGLVAWFHLALVWVPLLVVGVAIVVCGPRFRWQRAVAVGVGIGVGLCARPNPAGAVRLAWVQIVRLMAVKGLPLRFGLEIMPFGRADFVRELIPLTILLLVAAVLAVRGMRAGTLSLADRRAAGASAVLALVFLGMTFMVARRACELFVVFAVAFAGVVWTAAAPRVRSVPSAVLVATLAWALAATPGRFATYRSDGTFPADMEGVGAWLRAHAQPGQLVLHVAWEKFAELFFWDDRLRYVSGMDPVFAYDYDPGLYWKYHHLSEGAATTCDQPVCTPENGEDTARAIAGFGADYVLVDRDRQAKLTRLLGDVLGYEKVYEARGTHVVRQADGTLAAIAPGDTLFRVGRRPGAMMRTTEPPP